MKIEVEFYFNTAGCYIISDSINQVVGYICNSDNYGVIDLSGDSIYVSYLRGDMSMLLDLCPPDIEYIIFERNGNGRIKKYSKNRFKKLVDYISPTVNI